MRENSLRILLIEDNPTDVLLLEATLEEVPTTKFLLTHATRLDAGLQYLDEQRYDAVLLDLGLPDSQGLETFARIQRKHPQIPILVLSGLDDETLALDAVGSGAQDYLIKGRSTGPLIVLAIRYAIERKKSEHKLMASEMGYRRLFETTHDGIFVLDAIDGRVTDANPFLENLLGYASAEFIGKRLWEIAPFRDKVASHAAFRTLQEKGYFRYDALPLMSRDGRRIHVEFASNVYEVGNQRVIQCNLRDITERKRIEQQLADQKIALERANGELEMLSVTDGLTGLKNHRAFHTRLCEEFDRSTRYGTPLSLILLDVDHFKQYNDSYGHPAGDGVLKTVAQLLQKEARHIDFIARYGGEEFAIILADTDYAGAWIATEKFRVAVEAGEWHERAVTASFGVATKAPFTIDAATLVTAADEALYRSKEAGRNVVTHAPYERVTT